MQVNTWQKCYDEGWQSIIVPEAFAHPAKMSYGLLKRILAHAQEQGWFKGVILDPFGGIGSTGILGAYEGYQVVCVELEQKFADLAKKNFELHTNAWVEFGNPEPIILQGDSRRLCEVVEKADCIVSSPPFSVRQPPAQIEFEKLSKTQKDDYGQTPGQLGAMKPGNVDMIVSSPPYAETLKGDGTQSETAKESRDKRRTPGGSLGQSQRTQGYGSKGNLGNLKSGDPPDGRRASVDCVISSPPWESQEGSMQSKKFKDGSAKMLSDRNARGITGGHYATPAARKRAMDKANEQHYGDSRGQLGQEQGDTFWSAAKIIVEQCYQILRPGGHAIWVVKSFVRNKKIVDFPGDWQRLCEAAGFKTVCVHHAMLVKETEHETLFGDTEVKRKERKSFFRRLAESKGSPRIDYEVVLCMSKEGL